MKILITGNLGYVGPWVTRQLRKRYPDATLVGLDIGYFAHCLTNARCLPESPLDLQYFVDLRRLPAGILADADAVVHLAAISNDPMGKAHEAVTLDINFHASVELARQAKAAGVKSFVFASSCSVYGFAEGGPRTETSEVAPLTAYAQSKVLTEEALTSLADSRFHVTCLRFATACGMSDRLRLDLVLNDFVASAISTGRITMLSDGTPWRPLINVQDMARAIEWAIDRELDPGGPCLILNAGSNEWNYQVRDLAESVAEVIPGIEVSFDRDAPPDKRSYRVDFSLFHSLAPFHVPRIGLRQTVEELRLGLEEMRFSNRDFRESSFMRLRVLADLRSCGLLNEALAWTHKPIDTAPAPERVEQGSAAMPGAEAAMPSA
jgi:nucleoside-diphosphate-sugar epimerase